MKKNITSSGVYKITHTVSGHYYYGGSKHVKLRLYQMRRRIETKQYPNRKFKDVVEQYGDTFTYEILKYVPENKVDSAEGYYLKKFGKDPLSLNIYVDATSGSRNMLRTEEDAYSHAKALVGTNLTRSDIIRSHIVTFVSPEGVEYTTKSVKKFSKEHGLNQPSMNDVANGIIQHHRGWHLPSTDPKDIGGPLKHLDITIISPEGDVYHNVTNLYDFCMANDIPYHSLYKQAMGKPTLRPHTDYADAYGRRWYVEGKLTVYEVTDTETGGVYENVTVLPALADTLGIDRMTMLRAARGTQKLAGKRYKITVVKDIL